METGPSKCAELFSAQLVTGRHETGSYYTPKPVVSFMGREALKGYLQTACPQETEDAVAAFVDERDPIALRNPEAVLGALRTVTICDPACGSGAYLVGMLHELLYLRQALFATRGLDAVTTYQRKLEIIQNNLYGVDIDPFAVNIARLRLWLSLVVDYEGQKPEPLPNLDFKIEVGDSLTAPDPSGGLQPDLFRQKQISDYFRLKGEYMEAHGERKRALREQIDELQAEIAEWAHPEQKSSATGESDSFDWIVEFAEIFSDSNGKNGGFDIVIANPPYVRHELLASAYKDNLKRVYSEVYSGMADIYVYFYMRATQLLGPQGVQAYISSNKWLRARYGKKLRVYLDKESSIQNIIDFGELPVFQSASTFPMIFIAEKGSVQQDINFTQVPSLDPPYPDVGALISRYGQTLPKDVIDQEKWTLTDSKTIHILRTMDAHSVPLERYIQSEVYRGIVTGLNKAFIIDTEQRNTLLAADPNNAEIIKPLAKGNDVRRWRVERKDKWLIFARRGIEIDRYPVIKEHLAKWKADLTPKRSRKDKRGRKPGNYKWYEIQDEVAYYKAFEQAKIVYPDIAKTSRFTLDTNGLYFNNTTYLIPVYDLYLLGVLNSTAMWTYAKENLSVLGDANRGGRLRFFRQFVLDLPIPDPPHAERSAVAQLVEHCLDSQGKGQRVKQWEEEIDERVAYLYGIEWPI